MPARKQQQQKDVMTRLQTSGEEALQKLVDFPGGSRLVEAANALRDRVDELSKRMRSLDPLEKRVAELERRLDELSKPKPTRPSTTSRARSTAKKPASSSTSRARKTTS
jgi:hypothetical protein